MEPLEIGVDYCGIGAFEQALRFLNVPFKTIFACDKDKYARKSYIANYGVPEYFPEDVYEREIPKKPLGVYVSTPPCQPFSLSGKRLGEEDKRGILFYNTHEFIKKNKPRVFIIENVKGLLSHDPIPNSKYGRTFSKWLQYLGGKSINNDLVFFPHEDAVPYHIHFAVLNAKDFGVPQNRERVFIVGIRDDADNVFKWPEKQPLTKKLKDVLEVEVDPKYFLSEKMINWIVSHRKKRDSGNKFPIDQNGISKCITSRYHKCGAEDPYVRIKSATSKGYELATENDSINFSNPNSETRRGRVGKEVAQTLDTGCNQGVCIPISSPEIMVKNQNGRRIKEDGEPSFTLTARDRHGVILGEPPSLLNYKIRKLTPREFLRLMDFPDSFKMVVSDTQIYKQAGNSIVRAVLAAIVQQLLPIWSTEHT